MLLIFSISLFILVTCSFLALIESTIVYTDELKLNYLLSKNKDIFTDRKKKILKKIIFKKEKYISSVAIISTCVNIVGSGFIGALVARYLDSSQATFFMIGYVYFMLIFSKIAPKVIAVDKFEFFLDWFAYFINVVYYFTTPILLFTLFWIKIFKFRTKKAALSIKELKSIIHYYTEKGTIHSMEETMIDQLLSIKKKTIADIIQGREELLKLNYGSKLKKYRLEIINNRNKIYSVHKNNEVMGIAFYRDIADLLLNDEEINYKVSDCVKTAFTLNTEDDVFDAILKFKKNKDRYAIVINKDNDVVGIVTAKQVYTYALK